MWQILQIEWTNIFFTPEKLLLRSYVTIKHCTFYVFSSDNSFNKRIDWMVTQRSVMKIGIKKNKNKNSSYWNGFYCNNFFCFEGCYRKLELEVKIVLFFSFLSHICLSQCITKHLHVAIKWYTFKGNIYLTWIKVGRSTCEGITET